jgi:hypothetical protein
MTSSLQIRVFSIDPTPRERSTRRWRWRRELVEFLTLAAGGRLEENAG